MRRKRWMIVAGAGGATLAFLASYYFFSLGILFESGCHLGDAAACASLTRTLRVSLVMAGVGLLAVGATCAAALRRRTRA